MKNLIIALSLLFAVGATAQVKKAAPKAKPVAAKTVAPAPMSDEARVQKNLKDLNAATPLTDDQKEMFKGLFVRKYEMYHTEAGGQELSAERKAIVAKIIERKLEASLDGNSFAAIKANNVLFSSLINE